MRPDHIILHHSATEDSHTHSWAAIRNYHTSWKCDGVAIAPDHVKAMIGQGMPMEAPWDDIGYHFGIERIGIGFEIMTGRMMTQTGAHCTQRGMNRRSLGICFVGNFDQAAPPVAQWRLGLRLVKSLMDIFDISIGRVMGHRELAAWKSCPGRAFNLNQFRTELLGTV